MSVIGRMSHVGRGRHLTRMLGVGSDDLENSLMVVLLRLHFLHVVLVLWAIAVNGQQVERLLDV